MSIFNKIKNVLFTEEEETEEIPTIEGNNVENKVSEEEYDEYIDDMVPELFETKEVSMESNNEETTIKEEKSPFQSFDEEEFDRIAALNKKRLLEQDKKAREEKERKERLLEQERNQERERQKRQHEYETRKKEIYYEPKVEKEEEHKFKPSPVISPVYGVLDKNYTKDDILPRASSDGTLPKIMDVDAVRKKAFGKLEEEDIDLSNIKITTYEEIGENIVVNDSEEIKEEVDTRELPKIEEETIEEKKPISKERPFNVDDNLESELPKSRSKRASKKLEETKEEVPIEAVEEEKQNSEDLESDLFDLIDSMYEDGDK